MSLMESFETLFYARLSILIFITILFLQSGLDKVFNFSGNKSYIKSVFEKTFLSSIDGLLFVSITILEVVTGIVALTGSIQMCFNQKEELALIALLLSSASLLSLFAGQRISKDYGGASAIVPYFIVIILGLYLFSF